MSLSDIYQITKLPRVSKDLKSIVQITPNSDSEYLKLGISGSSISKYILKPSPKLIWSKSIPPNYEILSIENYIKQKKGEEEGEEDEEFFVVGVYDKNKKSNFLQIIQVLNNDSKLIKDIKLESKIQNIKIHNNETIIVVLEESIVSYNLQTFEVLWKLKNLYNAQFSEFISDDIFLVVEKSLKKSSTKLNYRLINYSGLEINSKINEFPEILNFKFTFNQGILYQYSIDKNSITSYQLPHFQQIKFLDLNQLDIKDQIISLRSPAIDRLLLTTSNKIILINLRFEIVLDVITSNKEIQSILQVETPKSNSFRDSQNLFITIARDTEISALTYSLDSNTIRDSLGKKQNSNKKDAKIKFFDIPSILDIKQVEIPIDQILNSNLSITEFDGNLLKFLEAKNDYYTDSDKIISSKLITTIVNFIFNQFHEKLPERSLTYLLTHPLFPQIDSLLEKLRSKPRLLRQAIVTSNISLNELLNELNTTENDEIFKDLIVRLLEFPREKLNFKDLNNLKIISKIIELDFGFELISILIDSNGIFMWKDEEFLNNLVELVESKIESLNSNSKILSVLDSLENRTNTGKVVKKLPLYSVEKLSFN
ncbi:hypothetical protein WICMUC_004954 [Wickerhamomyces mucosus]|uniref:U3 small nucleolar RNA-associated protein 8 n=1 Tax=Wickerhamomyces mucosus TaxID=1378264 RepID=A0A9P8PCV5_9ASCO|nr:hypothetical protein WICMUC_004954 [Wickerhamomyces mucosus]